MEKKLKLGRQFRGFVLDESAIDLEARTVSFVASTEAKVPRYYGHEILDHGPGSLRTGRLDAGCPLLADHNQTINLGIIETYELGADRKLRATVKFATNARAVEIYNDIVAGVRPFFSVGYSIHAAIVEQPEILDENYCVKEPAVYRITDWEIFEISSVLVPADENALISRQASDDDVEIVIRAAAESTEESPADEATCTETEDCTCPVCEEKNSARAHQIAEQRRIKMDEITIAANAAAEAARVAESTRTATILELGSVHNQPELARQFCQNGRSADEFKTALLTDVYKARAVQTGAAIGANSREIENFSVVRAINALITGDKRGAELEFEMSEAAQKLTGRQSRGFMIPMDVLSHRTIAAANKTTASEGGHLVSTQLGSMIEMLRNKMALEKAGITTLSGLVGDITLPRQNAAGQAYWLSESAAATVSKQGFTTCSLSPKTCAGWSDITRKLLAQASQDVELLIRNDLCAVVAREIDRAILHGAAANGEIKGVVEHAGIGSVALGELGGDISFGKLVDLESCLNIANADAANMKYITNARTAGKMKQTLKNQYGAAYLLENGQANGYDVIVSNQVSAALTKSTAEDLSAIFFAAWDAIVMGLWGSMDVSLDPYSLSTSGSARIVVMQDVDATLKNPAAVAAILDCK